MPTYRNQTSGRIPPDHSDEAVTKRKRAYTMLGCFGGDKRPEEMVEPHNATLDQMMPTLEDLGNKGDEFAKSLYAQWEQGKTLSAKQDFWVRKLYAKVANAVNEYARKGGLHWWKEQGTKIHYACTELGTGASTHYMVCHHCGAEAEYDTANYYSGD